MHKRQTLSVPELIQVYQQPGGDDDAGPELKRRGQAARNEVIAILDSASVGPQNEDISAMVNILQCQFPSQESIEAMQRLRTRTGDPALQRTVLRAVTKIRAKLNGRLDRWLMQTPAERDDFDEVLLASAAPTDRILLLPEIAYLQMRAGHQTTAEKFARELLADPDLAVKTGEGVYYANHVLGMIAFQSGDISSAKRYLVESAKTPGSPWLGQATQDMGLAEALVKHGEHDAVIEYLELCKRFWKEDMHLLDAWQTTIRAGGVPRFDQDRRDP